MSRRKSKKLNVSLVGRYWWCVGCGYKAWWHDNHNVNRLPSGPLKCPRCGGRKWQ